MLNILLLHQNKIIASGLQAFLNSTNKYKVDLVKNYSHCLESAKFLQGLGKPFVIIAEGNLLNAAKCSEITNLDQARLILCDRPANQNALILALNYNSSYVSLDQSNTASLTLAIECASIGGVFVCPQAKKELNNCVFQSKLEQRQAIASLTPTDQQILALAALGHTHATIGKRLSYSAFNIGSRLKVIVQKLNLQTKQEAIALATSVGLSFSYIEPELQAA